MTNDSACTSASDQGAVASSDPHAPITKQDVFAQMIRSRAFDELADDPNLYDAY